MRRRHWVGLTATLLVASTAHAAGTKPQTVAFHSGDIVLHGFLYRPDGNGPFPAVLFNHGGSPGFINNAAFDAISPYFLKKGWVFFAPYRRGQGLSADAGEFVQARVGAAEKQGGPAAGDAMAVHLLSGEQLDDQIAAVQWLEAQPFVAKKRIAVMGNSVGGIETVLGAERHGFCAAVDLTGAAITWDEAPALRSLLTESVQHVQAPILFIQAENDYSIKPSKVLYATARKANRDAEIHIYPPFKGAGEGGMQGHSLAWLGVEDWFPEAFGFIAEHCRS
jgi:carboxymethylenebutenolidase